MNDVELNGNSVAVIGMAGRFPGARTIAEFWQNLRNGVESIRTLSDEELAAADVDPALLQDPAYVRAASVLDGIDQFDAGFFGFSPKDARIMDPQHRVFLECAWEALENAGWRPDNFPGTVGVYAGSGMNAYLIFNLLPNRALMNSAGLFLLKQTGNDKDVLATRISYQLNLTGPSLTIQTACSTSLVAVHSACQSLLHHECDMALAGGVTIEIPHAAGYLYREGEILSRDGHCRTFDASSSGTVFGSGAGMVVLRRLEDALKDGDCIHAIIRGSAINNDGARKVGYLAPSVAGQSDVISEAMGVADVQPEDISYVETHGTGTSVGDPIEVAALTQAFRQGTDKRGFCGIGSLKTNIGHLDAAAGVAGLIKTILALKHKQLPPSLHFSKANPHIDFASSPFYVNHALAEWKAGPGPRRAGVTSLGIGGTNAHVILEEAPEAVESGESRPWQVLTLSARTPAALEAAAENFAKHLEDNPELNFADAAFTCHVGRKTFAQRRAAVCRNTGEAISLLRKPDVARSGAAAAEVSGVAFLFPGQGSQYPNMARGLYQAEPAFRATVDRCCDLLQPRLGMDLRTLLFPADDHLATAQTQLSQTAITQPALFTIEYALAKLWMQWGIRPGAMIGHSIGEYAAACIAGVFTLEDALAAVAERGRLMQSAVEGAMLALPLAESDARAYLSDSISLAAINAPKQCVLSGTMEALDELEKRLTRDGVEFHRLRTSHAFHSKSMEPILGQFTAVMAGLQLKPPALPYISNLTGTWIRPEEAVSPAYWARHLRETVRFSDGLQVLIAQPCSHLLEVGPGRVLSGLAGRGGPRTLASVRSANEKRDDAEYLMTTLGELWVAGAKIDWTRFHAKERRGRVPLPAYPFERQRFWVDAPRRSELPDAIAKAAPAEPAAEGALTYYNPVWKKVDLSPVAAEPGHGPWLVFLDSMGLGAQVAKQLEANGQEVITVTAGERYTPVRKRNCTIQPGHKPDYESLIADLVRDGKAPQRVIHCWAVTQASGLEELESTQNLCFYSLLYLAQACGAQDLSHPIEIGIVSNGLHRVAGEAVHAPERAILLGPARVIPKEFSNITCRVIDAVSAPDQLEAMARQTIAELTSKASDALVAYRQDGRWVQSVERTNLAARAGASRLRKHGVYVITGGLGGVGLHIAELLARSYQAKLVLVGRTNLPEKAEWEEFLRTHAADHPVAAKLRQLQVFERLGAEILLATGDVTNLAAMNRVAMLARDRFGAVHGVIHAAGVLDDGLIQLKTRDSADRVLAPKVKGTLVLDSVFGRGNLDFFALFSSISSYLRPVGQVDYVAASAFLDTFASAAPADGRRWTVAIDWGRWRDTGMGAHHVEAAPDKPADDGRHPFLGVRAVDTADALVYNTALSFDRHWILNEHRLRGGDALFPGTGYIELVRAAMAGRFNSGALEIRNLVFHEPLRVAAGETKALRINLLRIEGRYEFSVAADGRNYAEGTPSAYATCSVSEYLGAAPSKIDVAEALQRCSLSKREFDAEGQNTRQGKHIQFGPRWRCLKEMRFGSGEAISLLELPEAYAPEMRTVLAHPSLMDAATGSAMLAIKDYDLSTDVYVPASYSSFTLFGALPRQCYCHVKWQSENTIQKEVAIFDVAVTDLEGQVVARAEGFVFRRLSGAAMLQGATEIDPAMGVGAFEAILAGPALSQVVAAPAGLKFAQERAAAPPAAAESRAARSDGDGQRNEVEQVLTEYWEELLGVDHVGAQDDFFDLGGHSLIAVRLFAKIKKHFGLEMGLATLFEARTIESLAKLVREQLGAGGSSDAPWPSMVKIRVGKSDTPLFFVHGLGGNVVGFGNLLRHMDPDETIYALQAQGVDGKQALLTTVEDMAAQYISEIQTLQPKGPYYLAGYSFGGLITFEMAQQLHAQGQEIALVALFDTTQMHTRKMAHHTFSPKMLGRYLRRIAQISVDPWALDLAYKRIRNKLAQLMVFGMPTEKLIRRMYKTDSMELPKTETMIQAVNIQAAILYKPKVYPGRLTLFRAATRSIVDRYDTYLGWSGLAAEGVEVHELPGDHVSVGEEPNVAVMAEKFQLCVHKARNSRLQAQR